MKIKFQLIIEVTVNSLDNKELNKNEMIDKIKNPEKPGIIDKIPSYETINPEDLIVRYIKKIFY